MNSRITGKRFKSITMVASAVLLLGAFNAPADAKNNTKRTERTVWEDYDGAAIMACYAPENIGCTRFGTTPEEKYISIEIDDILPTKVSARVFQDLGEGDNILTRVASICGRSGKPIPITPGADVVVQIWGENGTRRPDRVNCPGPVSSGTITMAFSNLP